MIDVKYIDHMGSDITVVNSARVSYGNTKEKVDEKDKKLIKYLADHKHMSPFEHCSMTILVRVPLYIRSQIHRHRTFSYNEISRRYTSKDLEFFVPKLFRKQHKSNRQASEGDLGTMDQMIVAKGVELCHRQCLETYNQLLDMGVCREQARGVLPQNLMTEFYMTGNLRNWVHFIKLRDHEGAQEEVRQVAEKVKLLLIEKFGYSAEVLLDK